MFLIRAEFTDRKFHAGRTKQGRRKRKRKISHEKCGFHTHNRQLTSPMVRINDEISQVIGNNYFYFPRAFRDIKCRTLIKMTFKVLKNYKKIGESDCKIIFTGFLSSDNLLTQQLKAISLD